MVDDGVIECWEGGEWRSGSKGGCGTDVDGRGVGGVGVLGGCRGRGGSVATGFQLVLMY